MGTLHEDELRQGQDALFELGLATIDMTSDEKWAVEQLVIAYVADSVPPQIWSAGIDAGVRSVRRARAAAARVDRLT